MQQAATDDTIAWPPGDDGLRWWENQRMLCSCLDNDVYAKQLCLGDEHPN